MFKPEVRLPVGRAPESAAIADLNEDGWPDIIVTNRGVFGERSHLSFLLGMGAGNFAPESRQDLGFLPRTIRVDDFNADRHADLVVADLVIGAFVLIGNGDGRFQTPFAVGTGNGGASVLVEDLNVDGLRDLAQVDGSPHGNVWVFLGRENLTFSPWIRTQIGDDGFEFDAGDFDRNGVPDLAVVVNLNDLLILIGRGEGHFDEIQTFDFHGHLPRSMAVSELTGDGFQDLIVVAGRNEVDLFFGRGDGSFESGPRVVVHPSHDKCAFDATASDVNGDGFVDLLVAAFDFKVRQGEMWVLPGHGDGTFSPGQAFNIGAASSITVGDLDRDGRKDIVTANIGSDDISVLLNQGPFPEQIEPIADAGEDQIVVCDSVDGARVVLNGAASRDSNSTAGTNDDIVFFDWSLVSTVPPEFIGSSQILAAVLPTGLNRVSLQVEDRFGLVATDETMVAVVDDLPPVGRIRAEVVPEERGKHGPEEAVFRFVGLNVEDTCDASPHGGMVTLNGMTVRPGDVLRLKLDSEDEDDSDPRADDGSNKNGREEDAKRNRRGRRNREEHPIRLKGTHFVFTALVSDASGNEVSLQAAILLEDFAGAELSLKEVVPGSELGRGIPIDTHASEKQARHVKELREEGFANPAGLASAISGR